MNAQKKSTGEIDLSVLDENMIQNIKYLDIKPGDKIRKKKFRGQSVFVVERDDSLRLIVFDRAAAQHAQKILSELTQD